MTIQEVLVIFCTILQVGGYVVVMTRIKNPSFNFRGKFYYLLLISGVAAVVKIFLPHYGYTPYVVLGALAGIGIIASSIKGLLCSRARKVQKKL